MAATKYKIGGKIINFDVEDYLKDSYDIEREKMPQVNTELFLEALPEIKEFIGVVKTKIRVDHLYPTQNQINMEKVLRMVEKGKRITKDRKVFIASREMQIMDGHHRHVYMLIQDPSQKVDVYIVDMPTKKLLNFLNEYKEILNKPRALKDNLMEDYGQQPPEAVPGMGDVDYGEPSSADSEGRKGSGDFPKGYNNKNTPDRKQFFQNVSDFIGKQLTTENVNKEKSDKVRTIDENESIDWKRCVNIPVSRRYKKMDEDFEVKTMEGYVQGKKGDYLMRGVKGEMYPCDKDIFHKTYMHLNDLSENK